MQNIITSDIARLALHDSSFEKIVRHDQTLILVFDWSKCLNFIENNIDEPIIIGKTTMRFTGVSSEEFRLYRDEVYTATPFIDGFSESTIASNEINDTNKTIKITGFFSSDSNDMDDWAEWCFSFDTCEVSFNSYITRTEWLNGKSPKD